MIGELDDAWLVVEAFPRRDAALAGRLHDIPGVEAFRPLIEEGRSIRRARNGRPMEWRGAVRATFTGPRFPPFLFARLRQGGDEAALRANSLARCCGDEERRAALRRLRAAEAASLRGVLRELRSRVDGEPLARGLLTEAGSDDPAAAPGALIEYYRVHQRRPGASPATFPVGAAVQITAGPFEGFSGRVARVLLDGAAAMVEVAGMGRVVPVFVDACDLAVAERRRRAAVV
jgi:hypothetical protein